MQDMRFPMKEMLDSLRDCDPQAENRPTSNNVITCGKQERSLIT